MISKQVLLSVMENVMSILKALLEINAGTTGL
jgi:hypothetical protein